MAEYAPGPYIYNETEMAILDREIQQANFSQVLDNPAAGVNWLDAYSFTTSDLIASGLQPHSRDSGYRTGVLKQSKRIYTVEHDRDIQYYVDKADITETTPQLQAYEVSAAFVRGKGGTEPDAYKISKLAKTSSNTRTETITKDNVFDVIDSMAAPLKRYGAELTVLVDSPTMAAINQSNVFPAYRIVNLGSTGTSIRTNVTEYNGLQFFEVWDDDRFYDLYDFTEGYWPIIGESKKISIMMVVPQSVVTVNKIDDVFFWPVGTHALGNGYLWQTRQYYDIFLKQSMLDAVAVCYSGDAAKFGLDPASGNISDRSGATVAQTESSATSAKTSTRKNKEEA